MLPSLSLKKDDSFFPCSDSRREHAIEAKQSRRDYLSVDRLGFFPSPISIGDDSGIRARSSSPRNRSPKGRHHRRNRRSGKLIVIDGGSTSRWHARGIPGETLDPLVLSLLLRRSYASDISAADSVFHFVMLLNLNVVILIYTVALRCPLEMTKKKKVLNLLRSYLFNSTSIVVIWSRCLYLF